MKISDQKRLRQMKNGQNFILHTHYCGNHVKNVRAKGWRLCPAKDKYYAQGQFSIQLATLPMYNKIKALSCLSVLAFFAI